jgi:hypothetical protein
MLQALRRVCRASYEGINKYSKEIKAKQASRTHRERYTNAYKVLYDQGIPHLTQDPWATSRKSMILPNKVSPSFLSTANATTSHLKCSY